MRMDQLSCCSPWELSLNTIISDAAQLWSALSSLDKVTVRLMLFIFITQRRADIAASHSINLNLVARLSDENIWLKNIL